MKHIINAIDASIESYEKKVEMRQSSILTSAEPLLALHQLKEFYKEKPVKKEKTNATTRTAVKHAPSK